MIPITKAPVYLVLSFLILYLKWCFSIGENDHIQLKQILVRWYWFRNLCILVIKVLTIPQLFYQDCIHIKILRRKKNVLTPNFIQIVTPSKTNNNWVSLPDKIAMFLTFISLTIIRLATCLVHVEGKKMLIAFAICWRHYFLCNKEMSKNPKNW